MSESEGRAVLAEYFSVVIPRWLELVRMANLPAVPEEPVVRATAKSNEGAAYFGYLNSWRMRAERVLYSGGLEPRTENQLHTTGAIARTRVSLFLSAGVPGMSPDDPGILGASWENLGENLSSIGQTVGAGFGQTVDALKSVGQGAVDLVSGVGGTLSAVGQET